MTGIRKFIVPENPSRVAVLMDVPDMEAFGAAMQTDDAAKVMGEGGVRAETLAILAEAS